MEENSGFSREICVDNMISKTIVAKIYWEFQHIC
jgi:hypothetical protein